MARKTNAERADWHWDVYQQIKQATYALQEVEGVELGILNDIEDYGADTITFDVWTEGESEYEAERGYRPGTPLPKWRRDAIKASGFHIRRSGTVERNGEPVQDWLQRIGWRYI